MVTCIYPVCYEWGRALLFTGGLFGRAVVVAEFLPVSVQCLVACEFKQEGFFAGVVELDGGFYGFTGFFETANFSTAEPLVFDVLPHAQAASLGERL